MRINHIIVMISVVSAASASIFKCGMHEFLGFIKKFDKVYDNMEVTLESVKLFPKALLTIKEMD